MGNTASDWATGSCCDRSGRAEHRSSLPRLGVAIGEESFDVQQKEHPRRFDVAVASRDLATMVQLLKSKVPYAVKVETALSQGLAIPRTIGALAATQLAIWADEPDVRDPIREVGGLEALCVLVESDEEDKLQAAFFCLHHLTADNVDNCEFLAQREHFERFIQIYRSLARGYTRYYAEVCLINVCVNVQHAEHLMVELAGHEAMFANLKVEADLAAKANGVDDGRDWSPLVDTLVNLKVLLVEEEEPEDENDEPPQSVCMTFADPALSFGLLGILETLQQSPDDEVRAAALDLYLPLQAYKEATRS